MHEQDAWRKYVAEHREAKVVSGREAWQAATKTIQNLERDCANLRRELREAREALDERLIEHSHFGWALTLIHEGGGVCPDFDLCTHVSCRDSFASWLFANAGLKGEALPDA